MASSLEPLLSTFYKRNCFQLFRYCSFQELQTLCIKYREDIITVRVNAEHIEEKLRNENSFLKEQLEAEQHTKMTLEDTYQMEMDEYKEELSEHSLNVNCCKGVSLP